jgi:hypothetical protein
MQTHKSFLTVVFPSIRIQLHSLPIIYPFHPPVTDDSSPSVAEPRPDPDPHGSRKTGSGAASNEDIHELWRLKWRQVGLTLRMEA